MSQLPRRKPRPNPQPPYTSRRAAPGPGIVDRNVKPHRPLRTRPSAASAGPASPRHAAKNGPRPAVRPAHLAILFALGAAVALTRWDIAVLLLLGCATVILGTAVRRRPERADTRQPALRGASRPDDPA